MPNVAVCAMSYVTKMNKKRHFLGKTQKMPPFKKFPVQWSGQFVI